MHLTSSPRAEQQDHWCLDLPSNPEKLVPSKMCVGFRVRPVSLMGRSPRALGDLCLGSHSEYLKDEYDDVIISV